MQSAQERASWEDKRLAAPSLGSSAAETACTQPSRPDQRAAEAVDHHRTAGEGLVGGILAAAVAAEEDSLAVAEGDSLVLGEAVGPAMRKSVKLSFALL